MPTPNTAERPFVTSRPPSPEQLAFSKEASPADSLVDQHILFKWPVVGWCVGHIIERNTDGRAFKVLDGERLKVINFLIYYELDEQTVKTVLRLDEYGGEDESAWVLLERVA